MAGAWGGEGARRIPISPPSRGLERAAILPAATYLFELTLSGLTGQTRLGTLPWWTLPLIILPGFVALLWREDRPRLVFAVVLTQSTVLAWLIPTFQPIVALLVATYTVATLRPRREVSIAVALTLIPWFLNSFFGVAQSEHRSFGEQVSGFLMMVGITIGFVVLAWSQQRDRDLTALRSRTTEAEIAARIDTERLTIARELHDRVANSVAAIAFGVEGTLLREKDASQSVRTSLDQIHEAARQAMSELRDVLRVLQAADAPPDATALSLSFEGLLTQLEMRGWGGVDVNITQLEQPVELREEVEECAIRCMTEAITNAAKYGVTLVDVEVDWREDPVVVAIHNINATTPAVTFDPAMRGGVGLGSIIERINAVGGAFRLESGGNEFRLELHLPV